MLTQVPGSLFWHSMFCESVMYLQGMCQRVALILVSGTHLAQPKRSRDTLDIASKPLVVTAKQIPATGRRQQAPVWTSTSARHRTRFGK